MEQKIFFSKYFSKNFLKIFLCSFLFFDGLFSVSDEEILCLANQRYLQVPGFSYLTSLKLNNSGNYFELLSALWAEERLKEQILYFDLNIEISKNLGSCKRKNEITEYDVVTSNFLIESKSSRRLNNAKEVVKLIKQLSKEQQTIEKCREFLNVYNTSRLRFSCEKNNGRLWIGVTGLLKNNKKLFFASRMFSFDEFDDNYKLEGQWLKLIETIAGRKLKLFSKYLIGTDLVNTLRDVNTLRENDFSFYDGIDSLDDSYSASYDIDDLENYSNAEEDLMPRNISPENILNLVDEPTTLVSINSRIYLDVFFIQLI
ncbi:MAG: hypothetical protein WC436_03250 [Candidatus Babeliales bacterium]